MIEHGLSYLMPTRYLNQDLSPDEIHLLVGSWSDGVPAMELPVDEEAQSGLPPPISMRTTSGISASHQPTTRLGPFCRAAEAGHLLGQVLDLIAQSSYSREMDFEKARALDHAMQSFAMVLVQQNSNSVSSFWGFARWMPRTFEGDVTISLNRMTRSEYTIGTMAADSI